MHGSKTFVTFASYNNQNNKTMSTSPLLQADGAWADFCQRLTAQRIPTVKLETFGIHYDTMEVHAFHHKTLDVLNIVWVHEICPEYHEVEVETMFGPVLAVRHFDQLDEDQQTRIVESYINMWAKGRYNVSGSILHNGDM